MPLALPPSCDSDVMACFCLLPTCRFCRTAPVSSQGHRVVDEALVVSQVGEAPAVASRCSCFLPGCHYCSSVATPTVSPVSSQGHRVVDERLVASRVGEAPAVASRCSCCLPGCRYCSSVATSTVRQARPQPRKEARQQRTCGHKRPLSQELAEDSGEDSGQDSLLRVILLPTSREKHRARWQAVTDARPGPWEFWELWSGCGNFTAAVMRAGGGVGPSVDIRACASVPRLLLDLEDDGDVEFVWWLLHTYRPRYVHVAPSMHVLGAARPNESGAHACRVGGPPPSGGPTLVARHQDHAVAIQPRRRGILRAASSLHLLEATADRGPLVAAWLATVHAANLPVRPQGPGQRASVPEAAGLRVQRGPHGHAGEVLLRARLPPDG